MGAASASSSACVLIRSSNCESVRHQLWTHSLHRFHGFHGLHCLHGLHGLLHRCGSRFIIDRCFLHRFHRLHGFHGCLLHCLHRFHSLHRFHWRHDKGARQG